MSFGHSARFLHGREKQSSTGVRVKCSRSGCKTGAEVLVWWVQTFRGVPTPKPHSKTLCLMHADRFSMQYQVAVGQAPTCAHDHVMTPGPVDDPDRFGASAALVCRYCDDRKPIPGGVR